MVFASLLTTAEVISFVKSTADFFNEVKLNIKLLDLEIDNVRRLLLQIEEHQDKLEQQSDRIQHEIHTMVRKVRELVHSFRIKAPKGRGKAMKRAFQKFMIAFFSNDERLELLRRHKQSIRDFLHDNFNLVNHQQSNEPSTITENEKLELGEIVVENLRQQLESDLTDSLSPKIQNDLKKLQDFVKKSNVDDGSSRAVYQSQEFTQLKEKLVKDLQEAEEEDAAEESIPSGRLHVDRTDAANLLGEGSFGQVWKGILQVQSKPIVVAVKYIHTRRCSGSASSYFPCTLTNSAKLFKLVATFG